ncbi:MAG: sigma 54-interacting transcriptional regulator [Polyangia bacterium]
MQPGPEPTTVATVHSEALPVGGRPQTCQLIVVEGPDMGRGAPLQVTGTTVGTGEDCGLCLTDDRVSRLHMRVQPDGPRFLVQDLGSKNGTLYEGSMVTEARVPPGATFKLGRSFVRIQPRPQPLEVAPSQARRFGEMVAESLAMRELFAVLELAAGSDVTVLLQGETGTGKELCARALHDHSRRRSGPFVAIDCGALPETLLESELFGHVRGAFTGAAQARAGAFQRAHGGTIFLDELGGIPLSVQARLLRVIEERCVRPVGADQERKVDVRLLASSPSDLSARVAEGAFRPDLYYRLSVVKVALPPLRARREDIQPIVTELLRRRGLVAGRVAGPNLDRLMAHTWPGNVRELRNVIDRAIALSPGATCFAELRIALVPQSADESLAVRTDLPYAEAKQAVLQAFELRYLRDVLARCQGNISAASRESGIDRKHLRALLKRHGLWSASGSGTEDEDAPSDGERGGPTS